MSAADPHCARLAEMTDCAHRLGVAFAAEAERTRDWDRSVQAYELFDRCFFAVRMGIRLELRLQQAAAARPESRVEHEDLAEREDRLDHEGAERDPPDFEVEREREREPASLPLLLKTLSGVVAGAAALPGPEPAELPTLRELLAEVTATPAPERAPKPTGPSGPSLRARLAGAAAPVLPLTPPEPRAGLRRATGPPRR